MSSAYGRYVHVVHVVVNKLECLYETRESPYHALKIWPGKICALLSPRSQKKRPNLQQSSRKKISWRKGHAISFIFIVSDISYITNEETTNSSRLTIDGSCFSGSHSRKNYQQQRYSCSYQAHEEELTPFCPLSDLQADDCLQNTLAIAVTEDSRNARSSTSSS